MNKACCDSLATMQAVVLLQCTTVTRSGSGNLEDLEDTVYEQERVAHLQFNLVETVSQLSTLTQQIVFRIRGSQSSFWVTVGWQ